MIDIGLTKIALIGVVALVVIGPEKLPTVARMAGTMFGRVQRYISQVKSEVSREIEMDELRKMQQEVKDAAANVEQSIKTSVAETEESVSKAWYDEPSESAGYNPLISTPTPEYQSGKAKDFRRKRLARTSAIPSWYRHQHGRKARVLSGAARVAKYRPGGRSVSSGSFHS